VKKTFVMILTLLIMMAFSDTVELTPTGGSGDVRYVDGKLGVGGITSPVSQFAVGGTGVVNNAIYGGSNTGIGIYGQSNYNSSAGIGVFGCATTENGIAINGVHTGNGYAGYFVGKGFFNAAVGIGTLPNVNTMLHVNGNAIGISDGASLDAQYNGALMITKPVATGQYINLVKHGSWPWSIGTVYNSNTFAIGMGKVTDSDFNAPFFTLTTSGSVGIGITNPCSKLAVNGTISCKKIVVIANPSDFVFNHDYKLRPLPEVAQFITAHKHLPDIPSGNEMLKNGIELSDMQGKLLQKIEELTLYVIAQQERIDALEKRQER
jgi:hypothetical protein